eukprot:3148150-Rhodomonas_salina.1
MQKRNVGLEYDLKHQTQAQSFSRRHHRARHRPSAREQNGMLRSQKRKETQCRQNQRIEIVKCKLSLAHIGIIAFAID